MSLFGFYNSLQNCFGTRFSTFYDVKLVRSRKCGSSKQAEKISRTPTRTRFLRWFQRNVDPGLIRSASCRCLPLKISLRYYDGECHDYQQDVASFWQISGQVSSILVIAGHAWSLLEIMSKEKNQGLLC